MAQPDPRKLDTLLATLAEIKSDLNALRTDFLTHNHGTSNVYSSAALIMGLETITPTGGTSTAIAGSVPEKMFDSSR